MGEGRGEILSQTELLWIGSGGVETYARDCQGVEAPWPFALARMWTPSSEYKHHKMPGGYGSQGRMKKETRETEGPGRLKPRRLSGTWAQAEVSKAGGEWTRNNDRCRHAARGTETSGRGWRGVEVDDIQVYGVTHRERRWGEGKTDGATPTNG